MHISSQLNRSNSHTEWKSGFAVNPEKIGVPGLSRPMHFHSQNFEQYWNQSAKRLETSLILFCLWTTKLFFFYLSLLPKVLTARPYSWYCQPHKTIFVLPVKCNNWRWHEHCNYTCLSVYLGEPSIALPLLLDEMSKPSPVLRDRGSGVGALGFEVSGGFVPLEPSS